MRGFGPTAEELDRELREIQREKLLNRIYWPVDPSVAHRFISTYLKRAPGHWLPASEIYEMLDKCCRIGGVKTPSRHILGKQLGKEKYEKVKKGRVIYLDIAFNADLPDL